MPFASCQIGSSRKTGPYEVRTDTNAMDLGIQVHSSKLTWKWRGSSLKEPTTKDGFAS